jgi:hypothetical protein
MAWVGESAVAEGPSLFPAPNYPQGNFSHHPRPHGEKIFAILDLRTDYFPQIIYYQI